LGLYYAALGKTTEAVASFHKALFIQPEHVPAFVHLTQQYLTSVPTRSKNASADNASEQSPSRDKIDLAAGLLSNLTRGAGWDVPEAWYFLARARGLQGKRDRERECLDFALALVEGRGVRDIKTAIGWCL
jgi:tetratricopeptide (TPR) repeat protein